MPTISATGVVFPQDVGTNSGLSGSHDRNSAGYLGLLAKLYDSTYIVEGTLQFTNIGNDSADITTGVAVLPVSNISVQSSSQDNYDTVLPESSLTMACVTQTVTLSNLDSNTVNDVYLTYDASQQDSIEIVYGSGVSTPSYPYIKLGSIDTSDDTVNSRPNDKPIINARTVQSQKYEADDGTVYDLQTDLASSSDGGGGGGGSLNTAGSVALGSASKNDNEDKIPLGLTSSQSVSVDYIFMAVDGGAADSNVETRLLDTGGAVVGSHSLSSNPTIITAPNLSTSNGTNDDNSATIQLINTGGTDHYDTPIKYEYYWSKS